MEQGSTLHHFIASSAYVFSDGKQRSKTISGMNNHISLFLKNVAVFSSVMFIFSSFPSLPPSISKDKKALMKHWELAL